MGHGMMAARVFFAGLGMRIRYSSISMSITFIACLSVFALGADPAFRPNIVFILADDFGHELVGANGGRSYATPQLDRLASTGARFEHCYAQPLCTPTRVQILTGLCNQRNYTRWAHLDPAAKTFPQALREAGYRTCIAGKWQLSGGPDAPRRFGFDEHLLWQLSARGSRYANPLLEKDGEVVQHKAGEYGPDLIADFLCDFMRRNKDRPFFAFHSMLLTHPPFESTPRSADWDPKSPGVTTGQGDPRHFPDMVAHADRMVGRILATLDELGLREKTLVIFTGDNGTAKGIISRFADRVVTGGKGETTDAGTHVPLIVSWPGVVPRGLVSQDLVDTTDFFPTILEAARVPSPVGLKLDGRSFLPKLRGEKSEAREWVYSWFGKDGGPTGLESARDLRFRLHGDGRLYDVAHDPDETRDLSKAPLDVETMAARDKLTRAIESFRGTRRVADAVEPRGQPAVEEAVRNLRGLGAVVFRKDSGGVTEVVLSRRVVTDESLKLVARFSELTDLSLEETAVGDSGVAEIAKLQHLEWLNLYRTRLGDEGLKSVGRILSLKHLPIGETKVTDVGLAHLIGLTKLEYLGLRGNAITDAGVEHLAKLKSLRKLLVAGTQLSSKGIEALRTALPGCEIVTQ